MKEPTEVQTWKRHKSNKVTLSLLGVLVVLVGTVGCGGSTGDKDTAATNAPKASTSPTKKVSPTKAPSKKPEPRIDAKAMEKDFRTELGGKPIKSMCDAAFTHWSCFYDGVEAGPTYLRVNLTTDGGRSDADEMAKQAGSHWFNFIHCDYPDLTTIVVRINGIDHNVYFKDTKAGLLNC